MSEYFEHQIALSPQQTSKLKKLKTVTIKHPTIGSGLTIHVNGTNNKKIMSAYKKGKNHRLKLSAEELAQNEVAGSGFFQTLHKMGISRKQFNKGGKAAGKTIARVVAPVVKDLAPQIGQMAGMALASATGNPALAPVGAMLGNSLANEASKQLDKVGGSGAKPYATGLILPPKRKGMKVPIVGNPVVVEGGMVGPQNEIQRVKARLRKVSHDPVSGRGIVFSSSSQPTQVHRNTLLGRGLDPNHSFRNGYYNTLPPNNPAMHPFIESGLAYVGGKGFQPSGY